MVLLPLTELEKSAGGVTDGGWIRGGGKRFTLFPGGKLAVGGVTTAFPIWFQGQELVYLYFLTPCASNGMYALTFSRTSVLASQEWYDVWSSGSEKPRLFSTSDTMLKGYVTS